MECQVPLVGRSDKKFCSDECRVFYHNRKRRIQLASTQRILRILLQNRGILEKFWNEKKGICDREELLSAGFCFEYHTAQHRKGFQTIYECFEWSYQQQGKRITIGHNPK